RVGGPAPVEQRCLSDGQSLTTRPDPAHATPRGWGGRGVPLLVRIPTDITREGSGVFLPANEPLPVRKENFVTASIVSVPPADHVHHPNRVYENSPTFQMACRQLQDIAEHTDIEQGILERLSMPKRAIVVAVPIRMDDGSTGMFSGFRVQHSLTSGPSKGGL